MKKPKKYLQDRFCLVDGGNTVECYTSIIVEVMIEYAKDYHKHKNKEVRKWKKQSL